MAYSWQLSVPRDHPLWASFTRGDPRRWSFSDFRAIVLNGLYCLYAHNAHWFGSKALACIHGQRYMLPYLRRTHLFQVCRTKPSWATSHNGLELYEIWLRSGYDALLDFVLSSSQYYEPCLDYAETWERYLLVENTTMKTRESKLAAPNIHHSDTYLIGAIVQGIAQCIPEIGATLEPALLSIVRMIMVAVDNPRECYALFFFTLRKITSTITRIYQRISRWLWETREQIG